MSWNTQTDNDDVKVVVSDDGGKDGDQTEVVIIDKTTGESTHVSAS